MFEELLTPKKDPDEAPVLMCYFSGASTLRHSAGGKIGAGAYIVDSSDGEIVFEFSSLLKPSKYNTENMASYVAITSILKHINYHLSERYSAHCFEIYGNSEMVIRQMEGKWRVNGGSYARFAFEAFDVLDCIYRQIGYNSKRILFQWIHYGENVYASQLSREALKC